MDWINRAVIARAEVLTNRLPDDDRALIAAAVHRAIELRGVDGRWLVITQHQPGRPADAQWVRSSRNLFDRPGVIACVDIGEAAALYAAGDVRSSRNLFD